MPSFDSEDGCFVLKIVYDGAGEAGKTTSVLALARVLGRPSQSPAETLGRTLFFDWMEYRGGLFNGRPLRCQVVAVPGQIPLRERRRRILRGVDAVVFVVDSTPAGCERANALLEDLRENLAASSNSASFLVQANKQDRPDALSIATLRERLALPEETLVVSSDASRSIGVREAFVHAVRLALKRLGSEPDLIQLEESYAGHAEDSVALLAELQSLEPEIADLLPREVEHSSDPPPLPDAMIPLGHVWPPSTGRRALLEAAREDTRFELAADTSWTATTSGWLYHSSPGAVFPRREDGMRLLLALAHWHAAHQALLASGRVLALAPDGDSMAWRLWQMVRDKTRLRDQLRLALEVPDFEQATSMLQAAVGWARRASSAPGLLADADLDRLSFLGDRVQFAGIVRAEVTKGGSTSSEPTRLFRQIQSFSKAHGLPLAVEPESF